MTESEKKMMGQRIKKERELQGLSQDVLAEKLGMNRSNVSNYESGRTIPPGNILKLMSEIFKVDSDYILGLSNERRKLEHDDGIVTIAAHHDGDEWTKEELEEIEQFKEFVKMRRQQREQKGE